MAMGIERIGMVINPVAGSGIERSYSVALQVLEKLKPGVVLTGKGSEGEEAVSGWHGKVEVVDVEAGQGRDRTRLLTRRLLNSQVDALLVFGGDGTHSDVAGACLEVYDTTPIIGIGVGSTNAGNLITIRHTDVDDLDPSKFYVESMSCAIAYYNDIYAGVGFNDVVIGYTIVGTIEGRLVDLDAVEFMAGNHVPGIPRPIGSESALVTRIHGEVSETVASGREVGNVIVGLSDPVFFGKAITGGVCLTAFTGVTGGCIVTDQPIVRIDIDAESVMALPPIRTYYVSLNDTSRIGVTGIENAVLCVDGNPLYQLVAEDAIELIVRQNALNVYRLREE